MVGVGVKLTSEEEVVRIGQSDLRRLEEMQEERRKRYMEKHAPSPVSGSAGQEGEQGLVPMMFDVNVVGVRVVMEKGRVRNRSHDVRN